MNFINNIINGPYATVASIVSCFFSMAAFVGSLLISIKLKNKIRKKYDYKEKTLLEAELNDLFKEISRIGPAATIKNLIGIDLSDLNLNLQKMYAKSTGITFKDKSIKLVKEEFESCIKNWIDNFNTDMDLETMLDDRKKLFYKFNDFRNILKNHNQGEMIREN